MLAVCVRFYGNMSFASGVCGFDWWHVSGSHSSASAPGGDRFSVRMLDVPWLCVLVSEVVDNGLGSGDGDERIGGSAASDFTVHYDANGNTVYTWRLSGEIDYAGTTNHCLVAPQVAQ